MEHHAKSQAPVQRYTQVEGYYNSEMLSYLLIRFPNNGTKQLQNSILIKELDFQIMKTDYYSMKNMKEVFLNTSNYFHPSPKF